MNGSATTHTWLWDASRSFSDEPEFSYFNVNGWVVWDYAADGSLSGIRYGYAPNGVPTEAADLPTGTAGYAGRMYAEGRAPRQPLRQRKFLALRGSLALTADFGASTVGGTIDGLEVRFPGESAYGAIDGELTIGNGSIAGSQLTADLTGTQAASGFTGNMTGRFYGPAAAEVGGVLEGTYSNQDWAIYGYFGGTKQ